MKFERKVYDQVDYAYSQPRKINLSEVLAMDDTIDLEMFNDVEDEKEEVCLERVIFPISMRILFKFVMLMFDIECHEEFLIYCISESQSCSYTKCIVFINSATIFMNIIMF